MNIDTPAGREALMREAAAARGNAYCPYSHYAVGAALLTADGAVYRGCNMENAAYTPGICAERTAIYKAVSEGARNFRAIAVTGGPQGEPPAGCTPCGVCRQVMAEFCDPERFVILLQDREGQMRSYFLKDLLPLSFGAGELEGTTGL